MKKTILLIILYLLSLDLSFSQEKISNKDLKFYKELIKEFKKNSINKDSINWVLFEKKVLEKSKISKDSAIIEALSLNGESHSRYFKIDTKSSLYGKLQSKNIFQDFEKTGYIKIDYFTQSKTSLKETITKARKYINKRIKAIKLQDQKELNCWIIDLRNNGGGDMWPMIISLTPFLNNGILGYTVNKEKENIWRKENSEIYYKNINKTKKYLEKPFDYKLKNNNIKIAVLINNRTVSSAEATAIALTNNENVKFFGTKTFGYTTNNTSIEMKNGDFLILTTGFWKNYNGKKFKDGIIPDFESCNEKELKESLKNWIKK